VFQTVVLPVICAVVRPQHPAVRCEEPVQLGDDLLGAIRVRLNDRVHLLGEDAAGACATTPIAAEATNAVITDVLLIVSGPSSSRSGAKSGHELERPNLRGEAPFVEVGRAVCTQLVPWVPRYSGGNSTGVRASSRSATRPSVLR
jgi:hypothetical protein